MRLERGSPFPVSITSSAAFNSFHRVSMALVNNYRNKLIKWPPAQALRNTIKKLENMKGFPGLVGAIYGKHISIKAHTENPNDCINQKFFHSVQFENKSVDFNQKQSQKILHKM